MENNDRDGVFKENFGSGARERGQMPQGPKTWQVALLMLMSAALAAIAVVIVLKVGVTQYSIVDRQSDTDASLISDLLGEIKKYYYFDKDAPSPDKLINDAAHTVIKGVGDPYADYYTQEEFDAFRNSLSGNYKGIGVLVSAVEGKGLLVNHAYEDNPAYDAGVRDGDYITAVDGKSVVDMRVEDASALITGEDGTMVELDILRGEESLKLSVKRGDVYVKRVHTELLEDGIGYIRIDSFTGGADTEFDSALGELLSNGVKALVIDIRDNPGGELGKVVAIADRVLPKCTITTLQGKMVKTPEVYSSTDDKKLDIPYVVLTNGNSASASEIFAAAVQENKTGTIMGAKTFGKGIVQTTWEFSEGHYVKLTTDVYLTPNGNMIHGVGVEPDVIVEQDPELNDIDLLFIRRDMPERDVPVIRAVEFLKNKLG